MHAFQVIFWICNMVADKHQRRGTQQGVYFLNETVRPQVQVSDAEQKADAEKAAGEEARKEAQVLQGSLADTRDQLSAASEQLADERNAGAPL